MVHDAPSTRNAPYGGYVVRSPHAGDVLADSLKAAFGRDQKLPADMARCLSLLDRVNH